VRSKLLTSDCGGGGEGGDSSYSSERHSGLSFPMQTGAGQAPLSQQ
jgi:hypothetical protein